VATLPRQNIQIADPECLQIDIAGLTHHVTITGLGDRRRHVNESNKD
jgi:hypothetical protein